MALREYEVKTATGITLTVMLDDKTAKERGLSPVTRKSAAEDDRGKAPANKGRAPQDKGGNRVAGSASK